MSDELIILDGDEDERQMLRKALEAHGEHARLRYDPNFQPKPGRKDRNLETMLVCTKLLETTDIPGGFKIVSTDVDRRVIVRALLTYDYHRRQQGKAIDLDSEAALQLMNRIPSSAPLLPEPALVEPRHRYG